VESKLIARAEEMGPSAVLRRAPVLADFAPRFLNWVNQATGLAPKTRRYYRVGWLRISQTPLVATTLDHVTTEEVDSLALSGSPSYVNQALRTLRRLLGKAAEWKVIASAPRIKLAKEIGREQTIDPETESQLLVVAKQPLKDVLVIMQDTGLRPEEVFRVRIENIDWRRVIFNPHGKTRASRRHVLISERMSELLMLRCAGKTEGWLFPSKRAADGHLTTVDRQFQKARPAASLPVSLFLYCARHTFGTAVYEATGNLALVMKAMGHSDVRTAMRYQHPAFDSLREVIDQRNLRHNSRHSELRVQ